MWIRPVSNVVLQPCHLACMEKTECQERARRREGGEKKDKAMVVLFVFERKENLPDLTRTT